jgi:hypothetical protein
LPWLRSRADGHRERQRGHGIGRKRRRLAGKRCDDLQGWMSLGSVGAGEPDDRDGAVGFLLVAGVARLHLGDPLPRLRAGVSVELCGRDPQLTAAELYLVFRT